MAWLTGLFDRLRHTPGHGSGQEEGVLLLSADARTRSADCLSEVVSLTLLVSHLTDLRRRPLSELETEKVKRATGDFCEAMRKRSACPPGVGEPTCLYIALGQIERVRRLERSSPGQRLGTWCCLLVGAVERGEVGLRP